MLVELFAYIADQLATRIDWTVNENFLGTATQKSSVMRILKLIGYNFQLPIGADVTTDLAMDRPIGEWYLTEPYDPNVSVTLSPYTLIAQDLSGINRTFECLEYDTVNQRFEYKIGVKIQSGNSSAPNLNHELNFYEGVTKIDTFTSTTDNNPIFTLSQNPIIHNSIRVYIISSFGGIITETELEKVDSFLDPRAQQNQDSFGNDIELPYILTVQDNDVVTIEFGPTSLLPDSDRRLRVDDQIRVFYRVGGGVDGNITRNSINTTKRLIITPIGATIPEIINATFSNPLEGTGGTDSETAEHAITYAPLQIRTAEKAVTENDYNILLNSNVTVIKSQSYGNNNMPFNLYTLYGVFIKPLEVWNFVLKDKPGWEELEPSEYNDFRWISLRLENRFNEAHTLRDGAFDQVITAKDSDIIEFTAIDFNDTGIPTTFKNYVMLTMPDSFIDLIYITGVLNPNPDLKLKFCIQAIGENYFSGLSEYNMLYEPETTNSGLIETGSVLGSEVWQVYQPVNAYFLPTNNISTNLNMSAAGLNRSKLNLTFDNREPVEIDFIHGYQEFEETDTVLDTSGGAYTFKVDVDGVAINGGADLSITPSVEDTLANIAVAIATAINTASPGSVSVEVNTTTGRIRVISVTEGTPSAILFSAPGAGTPLTNLIGATRRAVNTSVSLSTQVTPVDIETMINTTFNNAEDYNNDDAPAIAYQELDLGAFNTYDDSDLADDTTYDWKVNEKTYSITTLSSITGDITTAAPYSDWVLNVDIPGDIDKVVIGMTVIGIGIPDDTTVLDVDTVQQRFQISQSATAITSNLNVKLNRTYADILTLIIEAMSFDITADIENGDATIINVNDNFDIDRVKYGMLAEESSIPALTPTTTLVASDKNWEEKSFELSAAGIANLANAEITLHEFKTTLASPKLRIESRLVNPKGNVYIEHGLTNDLIDALGGVGKQVDAPVSSEGIEGYHEFGLNVATADTAGHQECGFTNKVNNTALPAGMGTGSYYFFANIDGVGNVEYTFTLATETTWGDIVATLNGVSCLDVATGTIQFNSTGGVFAIIDGDLRCTSGITGITSTVALGSEGTTGTSVFTGLKDNVYLDSEFEIVYDGEAVYDSGLALATPYNFKINGYTYILTLVSGTEYSDIVTDLNNNTQCPDFPINFTASMVGTSPNRDIRITANTNIHIILESSDTSDLFTSMTHFTALDIPVGGGDYSSIAEVVQTGANDYLQLTSPCKGEGPSRIVFSSPTDKDVTFWIFGFDPSSNKTCYGYNRFTVIYNINHDDFGNVIFETGSFKLRETPRNFYANYLTSEVDSIYIGRYHYDNFIITDPSWREKGNRIYNTVYDEDTLSIDMENSAFIIKMTDEVTEKMSIFSIESDWNITESQPAEVLSAINPGVVNNLNPINHNIKINIDSVGDVTIDVTGDLGTAAQYDLDTLVTRINVGLTSDVAYVLAGPPYDSYQYASIHEDGDKILIKSPTKDNGSSIIIEIPAINDATQEFFGLKEGVVYTYNVTGDYYLEYEVFDLTGDLTTGSYWITDLSPADVAKAEVGMILLPIVGVIDKAEILEVDTTGFRFRVSKASSANLNNTTVKISNDLMKLNRITATSATSKLPDLQFFLHFVWDRRFVEGIYEDYLEGVLDEDIYDASLENNKIVGLNHIFKQTKFTTFDIVGTVYYDKIYSTTDVQQRVEAAIQTAFSLENRNYREPVPRSKIMSIVHEELGVDYINVTYLGPDATNSTTNELNTISAEFDEILILSENIFIGGEQVHGIDLNYIISEY